MGELRTVDAIRDEGCRSAYLRSCPLNTGISEGNKLVKGLFEGNVQSVAWNFVLPIRN